MSSTDPGFSAASPGAKQSLAPKKSNTERAVIAYTVFIIGALLAVAVWQTVGTDLRWQVRRWTIQRSSDRPAASVTAASAGPAAASFPTSTKAILAADSQMVAPRRAKAESRRSEPAAREMIAADAPQAEMVPASATSPENATALAEGNPPQTDADLDAMTNFREATARLVAMSWQEFDYPVSWHAAETSKERMHYVNHRNRLLKSIGHSSPASISLAMARKDYDEAKSLFDQDPRLDYAFGLVLWKHREFDEAIDQFQTAARLDGRPFLPGALAVAWGRILKGDESRGLDQLVHLARVLDSAAAGDLPLPQRQQAALLIGRALGFLSGPGYQAELAEKVRLSSLNIWERIPAELRPGFEAGRSQSQEWLRDLQPIRDVSIADFQVVQQSRHDDLQTQIEVLRQEVRDARNELTRSHRSHLTTMSNLLEQASGLRGQIESLQPRLQELLKSAVEQSRPSANISTKTMPGHYYLVPGADGFGQLVRNHAVLSVRLQETPSQRAQRVEKLSQIHKQRQQIAEQLTKLRSQHAELISRRRAVDREHDLDRDDVRRQRVARLTELRGLEQSLRELNRANQRTVALVHSLESIAAFIPWHVETEGEALWLALTGRPLQ